MTVNRDDPQSVVLAFAAAYNLWEEKYRLGLEQDFPKAIEEKTSIIRDFCTAKKRAYVDGQLSFQYPPVYRDVLAKNLGPVEYVTTKRAYVDMVSLMSKIYRFILMKKADGWRIDSVKWRFGPAEDWENTLIGS